MKLKEKMLKVTNQEIIQSELSFVGVLCDVEKKENFVIQLEKKNYKNLQRIC